MAYTALNLIKDAYNLSGILVKQLETLTGEQGQDGLNWLNEVLSFKSIQQALLPYYTLYDFTLVAGQEVYTIANLVEIDTFTFFIGDVRYSVYPVSREEYFGAARVNSVNTLPAIYFNDLSLAGMKLYVYYSPSESWSAQIYGKFSLSQIASSETDLSLSYKPFYLKFIKYELARTISSQYQRPFPSEAYDIYKEMFQEIRYMSPADLKQKKLSLFGQEMVIDPTAAFLWRGWVP